MSVTWDKLGVNNAISYNIYYEIPIKMTSFLAKNTNDIIYLSLLLFSVLVGPYYRSISSIQIRKWVGSLLGLLLIVIVSGYNSAHPIVSALLGIAAIKLFTVKYVYL